MTQNSGRMGIEVTRGKTPEKEGIDQQIRNSGNKFQKIIAKK